MNLTKTEINDVVIIEPKIFGDHRGWFLESYSMLKYKEFGIDIEFVQDNHSFTAKKGTIRGLHFQIEPRAQSKLLRCVRGKIYDIAVDLRKGSSTYLKWVGNVLSEDDKRQIFIPKGFAHGFISLTDNVEIEYKVDDYYSPECDRSIRYDDPDIGVDWGITDPILSEKDLQAPFLKNSDVNFIYNLPKNG
jgi:dTDP-4-dehydrorhamnose 3,5-epimerase